MSFFKRHAVLDEPDTDEENDATIDPELRLRTVRTAASAIAESIRSEQRAERRKLRRGRSRFFRGKSLSKKASQTPVDSPSEILPSPPVPQVKEVKGARRNVYVNSPLLASEVDHNGEPLARYVRNKVRTTKYTLITFVPKNLMEQFRRVANLYFLLLVIIQVFPIFGAAGAQIAMLPLAFILTVSAIKDGIEDYRRSRLDDEVNNSAATKLGDWRNVNQPKDSRSWFQKAFGLNRPGRVSKGVRKLREREAGELTDIVLIKTGPTASDGDTDTRRDSASASGHSDFQHNARLDDIQSVDSHNYPPAPLSDTLTSLSMAQFGAQQMQDAQARAQLQARTRADSLASYQQSTRSRSSVGVVNWNARTQGTARWERTLWKKLEVGDIVLLRDNDQVPADIVVLSTSDPEGMCYLETKNLDGETNLKPRKSLRGTSSVTFEEDLEHASFVIDSEPPHQNLYLYNGVMRYKDASGEDKNEPVTINELLLRGCTVRNTAWVIGIVVFTGQDTKIMLNGGDTPSKRSKIEKETNFNVIMNFLILVFMCLFSAIASGIYDGLVATSKVYYEPNVDPTNIKAVNALITFGTSLVIFQNIVPIALYISIEIVKTVQAYFILQDIDMYYEPFDTTCVPKTWNISDDLGQIEYIFSDKTGTLTQNIMEFQKCSVRGVSYGEGVTEAQRGAATRDGKGQLIDAESQAEELASMKEAMLQKMSRAFKNRYVQPNKLTLISPQLAEDLADRNSEQRGHLIAFFRALAICHTVLADRPEPSERPFHLNYKAESPDETALVAAARDVGFPFIGKANGAMDIEVMGQAERYVLLKVLEFNSTRKRMSVVVRNPEGKIVLYCKGADSVIYARLAADHDPVVKANTNRDMEAFANGGLRTLCIAYRYLTEEEYFDWSRVYDTAASAIKDRDEEIDKANEQVEHSLTILGATALEDKLQEGVPEAIETLHQAGIKLWILTGDKLQTAIEIGFSCNLLKQDMDIMILSAGSRDAALAQIEAGLNKIASVLGPPSLDPKTRGFLPGAKASFAVVIDGETLGYALDPALKTMFLNLGTQCETVVCCRVSPAQKALTVKLVKEGRNAMTLSIGDGANDVAMIQEANIGCGLFGYEGSQAAMSADYAFGQFRFLTKLLLVHGRWSYQRVADMHTNFFYKNIIWTLAVFWYLFFTSFDAAYLYDYSFILLYSLVFTSLPVGVLGSFDQDINAKAALAFPQLYVRGIRGLEYTRTKFWLYMLDGVYQSLVVFFVPYFAWTLGPIVSWNGLGVETVADFGTTIAASAIVTANMYVGINTHYWTIITWIINFGSTLLMFAWIVIYSFFTTVDFTNMVSTLFGELTFWTTLVLSVIISLAPRFLIKFFTTTYMPLDKDIVREMWVVGDLKDRLGIKHRRDRNGGSEGRPIFQQPHDRTMSEVSVRHDYQPAPVRSPPPDSEPSTPSPGFVQVFPEEETSHAHRDHEGNYIVTSSRHHAQATSPHSPYPSYYSASDIPFASPMTPTFDRPARETTPPPPSSSTSMNVSATNHPRRLSQLPLSRRASASARADGESGIYELQVRSPGTHSLNHVQSPVQSPPPGGGGGGGATSESFATAEDGWDGEEDDLSDRRHSSYSTSGAHAV